MLSAASKATIQLLLLRVSSPKLCWSSCVCANVCMCIAIRAQT